MADGHYEPDRALGALVTRDPYARQGEEQQRVLGLPRDWFGPVNHEAIRALAHPVRATRQWRLRRRLGPFAPEDSQLRP
jgi:hypothetical protein